jgi:hypothetical protein
MFKHKSLLLVGILVVVMLLGVTSCTPEQIQALQGTLKNLDSVSGNVTVTLKDGSAQTFNFNDIDLETIRETLGNASLEVGDNVTVKIKDGQVRGMKVQRAEVGGVIKSLSTDNVTNSVTIATNKKADITLIVTADTIIRIQGKATSTFSDLKVGQRIEVKYDVATGNALRINVNTGYKVEHEYNNANREQHRDGGQEPGDKHLHQERHGGSD